MVRPDLKVKPDPPDRPALTDLLAPPGHPVNPVKPGLLETTARSVLLGPTGPRAHRALMGPRGTLVPPGSQGFRVSRGLQGPLGMLARGATREAAGTPASRGRRGKPELRGKMGKTVWII